MSLICKYFTETCLAECSSVDFSFLVLVNDGDQCIKTREISSVASSHNQINSNITTNLKAVAFPVKYIFLTKNLTKTFTLSNLSPIFVRIKYSRLPLPISINTINTNFSSS